MRMCASSRAKKKRFRRKSEFEIFLLIIWCTSGVHQYGVSIQNSIKLGETFGQITQKRCNTQA